MKRLVPLLFLLPLISQAQQDPQFTMNPFNLLYVNPAVAGTNPGHYCGNLLVRHQWVGLDGQPKTYVLNVHADLGERFGGAGLSVSADQLGQEKNTWIRGMYSHQFNMANGLLSLGASVGLMNKSVGSSWRPPDTPADYDPQIPHNGASDTKYDLGFGAYYTSPRMYIGLAASHLTESTFKDVDFNYDNARHYYVMAGYNFPIQGSTIITPSVFAKSDGASTQIDMNVIASFNNRFFGGLSYRLMDAVAPMAGMYFPTGIGLWTVGYSYDITTSKLNNYSNGTHEISVSYCFRQAEDDEQHYDSRFMGTSDYLLRR